jgi:hypothetical protein
MAAEPVISPFPVCESCWMGEHAKWEPESMDKNGRIIMRLKGVEVPSKINNGSVEVCAMCGSVTIAGIYELTLTSEVYFSDQQNPDFEVNINTDDDDEI